MLRATVAGYIRILLPAPMQDLASEVRRIPLPRRWVNRRYDASSVDDPGYTDTVREDFDRIADLSEAEGWDRRVLMGPRRPVRGAAEAPRPLRPRRRARDDAWPALGRPPPSTRAGPGPRTSD